LGGFSKGKRGGPRVSATVVSIIMILFTVFIAGGGIYDLLDNPPSLYPVGNRWVAVHPFQGEQTINESIVSMILNVFMVGGLIVSYMSAKVSNDSRRANMMLIIGIALILMGLAGSHYLLILKRTIGR
jgi:Na+/proline symporter